MKTPWPLSRQIFAIAFINLVLLLAVLVLFAHYQYHLDPRSFLFAPARDRLEEVAADVSLDLASTPESRRTDLMARYAANYGVDFFLFENAGQQLAGRPVALPAKVVAELDRGRGGEPGADRPPPPPPAQRNPPPPGEGNPPPPGRGRGRGPGRGPGAPQVFEISAENTFWAGVRIPIDREGFERPVRGTLIVAAKSFYGTPLFFDFKPWLAALAASFVIFILCWLPFVRSMTKTLSRITKAAEQIGQGHFEMHLPQDRRDELGQLSVAINKMAGQLQGFVKGQKRFLGDIAHELCAPIARMQFGIGILEQQAEAGQKAAVEDVQEEIHLMSGLVSELLSFSKAGMQSKDHVLVPVDVAEVARESAGREATAGSEIHVEADGPVMAMADREYLLRSVGNLIRNAVRYAGDAGPVSVVVRRDGQHVVLLVSDSGPGLPPEELDRVFTPFYRLEASRNREHGGVGLGLAIVKSCVEICRGEVHCRNRRPTGLEVEIRLGAA
jgi:two-component system sensor histidine kinase CpxA